MYLEHLLVRHFRLIAECNMTLTPGIQLFLGLNAQGKTSLIEAILFLSTSTSHRANRDEELIQWGAEAAYTKGKVTSNEKNCILESGLEKKRKVIKVDGQTLNRVGDLYGHLRTVLFAPEDMLIVSGSPQERRRFIDMAIAQLQPAYITVLQNYRRALRQRNRLLKRLQLQGGKQFHDELKIWDEPFLRHAAEVAQTRYEMIKELAPLAENNYAGLADDGPLHLGYSGGSESGIETVFEILREKLHRSEKTEVERGSTQVGPHRDDLHLSLSGKSLSLYGSQGQRRAASLALRLAQWKHCAARMQDPPVALIDDVVYEMDNTRRTRFWDLIDQEAQLIVTATDREHLGAGLNPAQVFQVKNGEIHLY